MDDHHTLNMNDWYWDTVIELCEQQGDLILSQMNNYAKEVAKEDFKALRTCMSDVNQAGVI